MATREIKTRLAIDGERAFKQALANINGGLKVSQSELKAVTAEFGKNDKSMKALQARAKFLSDQIVIQKEKIGALNGAVKDSQTIYDKANEKYQEVLKTHEADSKEVKKAREALEKAEKTVNDYTIQLNNAKTALINTENELKNTEKAAKNLKSFKFSDFVPKSVRDNIADFNKRLEEAGTTARKVDVIAGELAKGFGKAATNAGKLAAQAAKIGAGTVKKSLEVSTKALAAYTTAAQGAATAIVALTTSSAGWADDLNTTAKKTHIATDELQKMQYAAQLIDVDVETVTGSIAKMINKLDSASGQAAFEQLGVNVRDVNGELRKSEDIFNDAISALSKIENETERDALAMNLFGKSAQELNPLIEGGAEKLKELGQQAEDMGLILSQSALDNLNDLNDSIDTIKANSAAAGRSISVQFAPQIKTLTDSIGKGLPSLATKFGAMFTGATGAGKAFRSELGTLASDLTSKVRIMLPNLLNGFNNTILGIAENIPKTVKELLPSFIGGLKDLVSGVIDILPEQIPIIIDAGAELFGGLLDGLNETLDKLIPMLPKMIKQIGESLTKNAAPLLKSGVELLANIVEGIAQSTPELVKQAAALIPELVDGLMDNIDKVIQAGIDLVVELAKALPIAIPAILEAVPEIIDALVDALSEVDWAKTAEDALSGIGEGVVSLFSGAFGIIDGLFGTNLQKWYDDITTFYRNMGGKIYEVLNADKINSTEMQAKYGSLDSYVTQSFNEYIRNGLNVQQAWEKAQDDNLVSGEAMAYFNQNFASKFTDSWLSDQAALVLKNASNSYDVGAYATANTHVSGMPSNVPQKNVSLTFNNYSPTEKTIYQQNRQNQQQLAIAKQYGG